MNDKYKISVIIPFYNAERTIKRCMDSVLSQTLKEVEIVCIDDGSFDASSKIIEWYVSLHDNILLFKQENKGAGEARNLGIKRANGQFVAFMDADDYYFGSDVLEELYNKAVQYSVNICGGSICIEKGAGYIHSKADLRKDSFFENNKLCSYNDYQYSFGFTRFIYNLSMLKENGINFPAYRRFEDPPFLVKAMHCAKDFYVVNRDIYVISEKNEGMKSIARETLCDIVSGIKDVMVIAQDNNYNKLYKSMLEEILHNYLDVFYSSIYYGNDKLYDMINSLFSEVDTELYFEYKSILMSKDEVFRLGDRILLEKQHFLELVKCYQEIIIYGAGTVGKTMYRYLKSTGYIGQIEFGVTVRDNNDVVMVYGKEIRKMDSYVSNKDNSLVIIAVKGNEKDDMNLNAVKLGFENIYLMEYGIFRWFIEEL